MPRAKDQKNGRLEEAIATLLECQTAFLARVSENDRQILESRRELIELKKEQYEINQEFRERFARIEAILLGHSRMLERLPDAVRERMGFKPPS